jgi:hypothetical protein
LGKEAMLINKIILLSTVLCLTSCSAIFNTTKEPTLDELFEDGWEFYIYNNDLVLKKETSTGIIIKDYFNKVMEK